MRTDRPEGPTFVLLTALLLAGCRAAPPAPEAQSAPSEGTPRLVLLLIVVQLHADYPERFRPLYRHGFDRLLRESAIFAETHHELARTQTAPGHATLATGGKWLPPSRSRSARTSKAARVSSTISRC